MPPESPARTVGAAPPQGCSDHRGAHPVRHRCSWRPQKQQTFSPLTEVLPERTSPELLYLEAKFAGLVSYGLSANLLGELLPLGRRLHATAVRRHMQVTAHRLEEELGPEQVMFIEGCPRDWAELPLPDLPLTVGLDGGYVHACDQRSRREEWFEVIAGKSMPADGDAKSFAYVQTFDTKPKRRLFELLPGTATRPPGNRPCPEAFHQAWDPTRSSVRVAMVIVRQ